MSYHNIPNNVRQSRINAPGKTAPPGYHYMPDGSLMSNSAMAELDGGNSRPLIRDAQNNIPQSPTASTLGKYHLWGRASCSMEYAYQRYINNPSSSMTAGSWNELVFTGSSGITHNIHGKYVLINKNLPNSIPDAGLVSSMSPGLTYQPWINPANSEEFYQWAGSPNPGDIVAWKATPGMGMAIGDTSIDYELVEAPVVMVYLGKSTSGIPNSIIPGAGLFFNYSPYDLKYPVTTHAFGSCEQAITAWENSVFVETQEIGVLVETQGAGVSLARLVAPDDTVTTKVITKLDLDLSDLPATSERRRFDIFGDKGAEFKLEIKDNTTGYHYNFVTNAFQAAPSSLEEQISGNSYRGNIIFPAVTGGDDQYDIFLYAKPGTEHVNYREFRFGDGSLDVNRSIGSDSLMMTKVIYQYSALTLTLAGYSIGTTVAGTLGTDTISINRGKPNTKTAFSFTTTAVATAAYRVLKQPTSYDVLAFVEPVVGSAPIDLPGENIYPAISNTDTTAAARDTSALAITMDSAVASKMKIGDRVTGNAALDAGTFTVASLDSTNVFSISTAVAIADGITLSFSNRMNFSWPINKFVDVIKEGMVLLADTNVTADTSISIYEDIATLFGGTKKEKKIIKNLRPALSTLAKKPTVVKGLVTVQQGQIVFNKQQVFALAGDTLKIGGYGESEILRIYGWDVKLTDLAIALTAPTTTTREATSANALIDVNSREGVINNVSRVGGIGIDPKRQNPLITAGGGATSNGDWTMDAVQTLENGATLTIENTSRIATITGNIQIVKAGTASQTLRFDINKLLSTTAP